MDVKRCIRLVIVNWNSGIQLSVALDAVHASVGAAGTLVEVVVVDNGSTDESLIWLRQQATNRALRLIELGMNTGFAHACNVGASGFAGDYLLFLNPDTRIDKAAIREALTVLETNLAGDIGIVGIQSIGDDGHIHRACARFPSAWNFINEALGLASVVPSLFPGLQRRDFDHAVSQSVDHVIGAFYFVRADLFRRLNGFDERFFVYLEDIDFSWRAAQNGYRCYFLAEAQMYHKGGGVSEQIKDQRLFFALRSRIQYAFKHLRPESAWAVTLVTLAVEPFLRLLRSLLHGSFAELANTASAFAMLYRALPKILAAT